MGAIFLSASVPVPGRGDYYKTATPFLIQYAVRELVIAVIRECRIIWGGHPAITPMVWAVCRDMGVDARDRVTLYQSRYFEGRFPAENKEFASIVLVEAVLNDRDASLQRMREEMLSCEDLNAAVFIGGMDGVEIEFDLFRHFHPDAKVLPVPSTGGAARQLAERIGNFSEQTMQDVDYARLFRSEFSACCGE